MTEEELKNLQSKHILVGENKYPAKITQIDWSKNTRKNSRFIEIHPQCKAGLKRRWVKLSDININPHAI